MTHESFLDAGKSRRDPRPRCPSRPTARPLGRRVRPRGCRRISRACTRLRCLSREQEAHLFRKMNFLKYRAQAFRDAMDPAKARSAELDRIEQLQEEALAVKNQIIRSNLRLVVSIAKRHVGPSNNFFELVSDGNMSLIRAVEKFDYSTGLQIQHVCLMGDHEELRPHDPGGELPPRPVRHGPRGDVRGRRRQPGRRARVRERPEADAGGRQGDARPARRPRATHHHQPVRPRAAPASRRWSNSAGSWGSPRSGSGRSSRAPRTNSASSPARRSWTCPCFEANPRRPAGLWEVDAAFFPGRPCRDHAPASNIATSRYGFARPGMSGDDVGFARSLVFRFSVKSGLHRPIDDDIVRNFTASSVAGVAQLAEHRFCKPKVVSSTLTASSAAPVAVTPGGRARPLEARGWIPKWLKGPDCKSGGTAFAGSNPAPPMPADRIVQDDGRTALMTRRDDHDLPSSPTRPTRTVRRRSRV